MASYAPLYRRGLELVIRIGAAEAGVPHSSRSEGWGTDTRRDAGAAAVGLSFLWSERVKARAMLDSLNRYGRRR